MTKRLVTLCLIDVEPASGSGDLVDLEDNADGLALRAESADLWHRCIGHINRKSMGALGKLPGNGVEYTARCRHAMFVLWVKVSNNHTRSRQRTAYSFLSS